jgi:hypothetical protein
MLTDLNFLTHSTIDIDRFREVIDALVQWIGIEASPGKSPAKRALKVLRGCRHEITQRSNLAFGTTDPNLLPGNKMPRNIPMGSGISPALFEFLMGETLRHLSESVHASPSKVGLRFVVHRGDSVARSAKKDVRRKVKAIRLTNSERSRKSGRTRRVSEVSTGGLEAGCLEQ